MSRNNYEHNSPQNSGGEGGLSTGQPNDDSPTNPIPATPPQKKNRKWLWILCGFSGLGMIGLVICCGVGSLYFTEISAALLEPTREELNELAQVKEDGGGIQKLTMNFAGTRKEAETNPDFVILDAFTRTGSRQFSVKMSRDGSIEEAFLILDDGTRQKLDLERRIDPVTD
jgi:hypothetical protein